MTNAFIGTTLLLLKYCIHNGFSNIQISDCKGLFVFLSDRPEICFRLSPKVIQVDKSARYLELFIQKCLPAGSKVLVELQLLDCGENRLYVY